MPLLEIDNVSFTPNQPSAAAILSGLSLSVDAGQVHALLGTNGTGKSTLASLVMGCEGYRPTKGAIKFDGQVINDLAIHQRAGLGIAMAWQEPVRFEGISVRAYIGIRPGTLDPASCLEMVGLSPVLYLDRMVDKSLSGGERKRIELASILALKPRFAVLDEPDSGIDMLSLADIINVISAFKTSGTALLLVTHREEIAVIADRASQICYGRIICSGDPQKVSSHYKSRHCLVCTGTGCHYV